MKRTLTAFTASIFALSLALPVLAQDSASDTVTTHESTRTEQYQPAPPVEQHTVREYKSERTTSEDVAAPPTITERKVTTTTEAVPPPETTTTTTTHRTTNY
ncbi:MAG TPA: hypothetical protein VKR29_05535 [Candidatus Binataceae bacterium]|jgi:hypothetical protein|nr:hypothetical protein [Candidatus Binataceae bacterium]